MIAAAVVALAVGYVAFIVVVSVCASLDAADREDENGEV